MHVALPEEVSEVCVDWEIHYLQFYEKVPGIASSTAFTLEGCSHLREAHTLGVAM